MRNTLKICHISDIHNRYNQIRWGDIDLSKVDVLVCSGDISGQGLKSEVQKFMKWFTWLPTQYKILIAGNHDKCFDPKFSDGVVEEWVHDEIALFQCIYGHYYLQDSGVQIDGVNFWGSPYSSWFHGDRWAFNVQRGEDSRKLYEQIPVGTDVLITHGPAMFYGDRDVDGDFLGCDDLNRRIKEVKPLLHLFGHIHEDYGYYPHVLGHTHHFNGSICTLQYEAKNAPWLIEADFEEREVKVLNNVKNTKQGNSCEDTGGSKDQGETMESGNT